MNVSFGLDHPLIAVNDIQAVRTRLESIGFSMTAIGKHPWGTSTSLAMFDGCLIEIMGIYDDTLLDVNPAGDFHFGRHIYKYLKKREGVALSALHSTDIVADIAYAESAELHLSGTLEFGRDVTLPNGDQGRTKTTLALLPDTAFPRLSFFLCQQHRPELIYVDEWMGHQNTVYGYAGVTIVAQPCQHKTLRSKFESLYGRSNNITSGFSAKTNNGLINVQDIKAIEQEFGELSESVKNENAAAIVAMDFYCENIKTLESFILKSEMPYSKLPTDRYKQAQCLLLTDPKFTGNTFFRFFEKEKYKA